MQEGGNYLAGQFHTGVGSVVRGGELAGAVHHTGYVGVDNRQVGLLAYGDVATLIF